MILGFLSKRNGQRFPGWRMAPHLPRIGPLGRSRCHFASLPLCHRATLPSCHRATLAACHCAIVPLCQFGRLADWQAAISQSLTVCRSTQQRVSATCRQSLSWLARSIGRYSPMNRKPPACTDRSRKIREFSQNHAVLIY